MNGTSMLGMPMPGMHGTPMSGMTMALPLFVVMMAAMMLPSAVPAIVRRARDGRGVLAAPLFAGSYLGVWALAGLAIWLLYRPSGAAASGALLIGAVVLAQKLFPPRRTLDLSLALGIVALGIATAAA